ncbi:Retrotransposon gag domain - like 10 [Theobroma cacao]|nr:Retrotransposon gag domain - like 10 [Theobroma cacao]
MVDQQEEKTKPLRDYAVHEYKISTLGLLPNNDTNSHIVKFLKICNTFKANGVTNDAIKLRLLPFSLRGKAKSWLNSLPTGSINTWDDLAQKFLAKFFPLAKPANMRHITSFIQFDFESLFEAWESFSNGLLGPFKTTIDVATEGPSKRLGTRKITGIHELDVVNTISTQLASLIKKIDKVSVNAVQNSFMTCEFCGEGHSNDNCPIYFESCQSVGNRQQNNPYSNTYNPGWSNHPNFSWNNNQRSSLVAKSNFPPGFSSGAPMLEKKPSMEDMLMKFMTKTNIFLTRINASIQNQATSIRNLETQVG